MTKLDGWAADRFGSARMMLVDALSGLVGVVLFAVMAAAVASLAARRATRAAAGAPAPEIAQPP
jgi:hypothetical protein